MRSVLRSGAPVKDDAEHDDEHDAGELQDQQQVSAASPSSKAQRRKRFLTFGLLPAIALILAVAAGVLRWQASTVAANPAQVAESVRAATDGTIAILSYRPDTVEQDLGAARDRLTGDFLNAYTKLTHDVVIPGAKEKSITAKATVPAAASVTASDERAVVIVFIDQTTTIAAGPPSDSASSVRVTLDKRAGRWLISGFDPV
ncbi:MAG: Mce-associated rane protein [Mycobacterium sp.]|nr:Mce-associated rane protein [Mycobacterium sp.]